MHFGEPDFDAEAVFAILDRMNAAVLVIDVQQGLCEGDGAAFEAAQTIGRINQVSAKARAAGRPVIFIQHESGGGYLEHGSAAWSSASTRRRAVPSHSATR